MNIKKCEDYILALFSEEDTEVEKHIKREFESIDQTPFRCHKTNMFALAECLNANEIDKDSFVIGMTTAFNIAYISETAEFHKILEIAQSVQKKVRKSEKAKKKELKKNEH